jgi:hypothetical protein
VRLFLFLILAGLASLSTAKEFVNDFAVVLASEKTEARFGKLPLDRAVLARAIENAARGGAKGVVVKFFLDRPKDKAGDVRLAQSMSLVPIILQARMDDAEQNPNILPERFTVSGNGLASSVQGRSGWIPLPAFSATSRDICVVDFSASPVPLIETYKGSAVKSLLICAAELAAGAKMNLVPGDRVTVGSMTTRVDKLNQAHVKYPSENDLAVLELSALLDADFPPGALKGKVVILGYDGPNIHTVATPFGNVGAHRAFILLLKSFYEST